MPKVVVYVRAEDAREIEKGLPLDKSLAQWVREYVAFAISKRKEQIRAERL
jgi:hypothetical protein